MEDLINRQAAIKAICEDSTWLESQGCTDIWMAERKQRDVDILSGLPSIDAVPVVRCKDCKHRPKRLEEGGGEGFNLEFPDYKCPCQCDDGWYNWMPDDNWFCGDAERKEE